MWFNFLKAFHPYSLPYQSINQLVRVLNIPHMLAVQFECCCCCCCYHFVSFIVGFVFPSCCYGCSCSWRYSNVAVASGATPAASAELAPHFCPHLQVKWNYLFCVCVHMYEWVCVCVKVGGWGKERVPLLTKYDKICARRIINKQYSSMFLTMQTSCHTVACFSSCCCCCHCCYAVWKLKAHANSNAQLIRVGNGHGALRSSAAFRSNRGNS